MLGWMTEIHHSLHSHVYTALTSHMYLLLLYFLHIPSDIFPRFKPKGGGGKLSLCFN